MCVVYHRNSYDITSNNIQSALAFTSGPAAISVCGGFYRTHLHTLTESGKLFGCQIGADDGDLVDSTVER